MRKGNVCFVLDRSALDPPLPASLGAITICKVWGVAYATLGSLSECTKTPDDRLLTDESFEEQGGNLFLACRNGVQYMSKVCIL